MGPKLSNNRITNLLLVREIDLDSIRLFNDSALPQDICLRFFARFSLFGQRLH